MLKFKRKVCGLLISLLSVGVASQGSAAPGNPSIVRVSIKDITGKERALPQPGQKATVLLFLAHDCPISNSYAPEMSRIATEYAKKGIQTLAVYAEGDFNVAGVRQHAKEYGFTMPIVWDNKYQLSHKVGATVTPEAVVLGPGGKMLYRGRIDNRFLTFGKKRSEPSQRDLRTALDAIVQGKPVPQATTVAVGCFIPE